MPPEILGLGRQLPGVGAVSPEIGLLTAPWFVCRFEEGEMIPPLWLIPPWILKSTWLSPAPSPSVTIPPDMIAAVPELDATTIPQPVEKVPPDICQAPEADGSNTYTHPPTPLANTPPVARALTTVHGCPRTAENKVGIFSLTTNRTQYAGLTPDTGEPEVFAVYVTFWRPLLPPAVKPFCSAYRQPFCRLVLGGLTGLDGQAVLVVAQATPDAHVRFDALLAAIADPKAAACAAVLHASVRQ